MRPGRFDRLHRLFGVLSVISFAVFAALMAMAVFGDGEMTVRPIAVALGVTAAFLIIRDIFSEEL